jgi:hypothetical protein
MLHPNVIVDSAPKTYILTLIDYISDVLERVLVCFYSLVQTLRRNLVIAIKICLTIFELYLS